MAPTHKSIGIGSFVSDNSLSLKINCVTPCLTAISAFFCTCFMASDKLCSFLKVQSIAREFLPKKLINLSN